MAQPNAPTKNAGSRQDSRGLCLFAHSRPASAGLRGCGHFVPLRGHHAKMALQSAQRQIPRESLGGEDKKTSLAGCFCFIDQSVKILYTGQREVVFLRIHIDNFNIIYMYEF